MSDGTFRQYPQHVQMLQNSVGEDGDLLAVDEAVLERFLEHLQKKNIKQTSIKRYFQSLSTFYRFLVLKRYVSQNPVLPVQDQYLHIKNHDVSQRRQVISIQQAQRFVQSILDPRERTVVVLLLKAGILRHELSELELSDVDIANMTIILKETGKRTNHTVFFDKQREKENKNKIDAYS